jgi:hypothetical protein
VAIIGPLVPRIRHSPIIGMFLDGVMIASPGLITVVTWQLLHAARVEWITLPLAAMSLSPVGLLTGAYAALPKSALAADASFINAHENRRRAGNRCRVSAWRHRRSAGFLTLTGRKE